VPKFPAPPDPFTLAARAPIGPPDLQRLEPAALLWRVHRTTGAPVSRWDELRTFGPTDARFDPHPLPASDHPGSGVIYLADMVVAALAEAFQLRRAIDRHTDTPYLIGLRLARSVELLDLGGGWPTRAGASQLMNAGPRGRARSWARAIKEAWPDLGGLAYPSSMYGGARCFALWEPAADALPSRPAVSMPLDNPALLGPLKQAADQLGYRLW
jgi:RES domain-containing protein